MSSSRVLSEQASRGAVLQDQVEAEDDQREDDKDDELGATLADVAVRLRDGTGVAGRPVTGLTAGIGV